MRIGGNKDEFTLITFSCWLSLLIYLASPPLSLSIPCVCLACVASSVLCAVIQTELTWGSFPTTFEIMTFLYCIKWTCTRELFPEVLAERWHQVCGQVTQSPCQHRVVKTPRFVKCQLTGEVCRGRGMMMEVKGGEDGWWYNNDHWQGTCSERRRWLRGVGSGGWWEGGLSARTQTRSQNELTVTWRGQLVRSVAAISILVGPAVFTFGGRR